MSDKEYEGNKEYTKSLRPVMQAYLEGKQIEARLRTSTDWYDTNNPLWDMYYEYRVKVELKWVPFTKEDYRIIGTVVKSKMVENYKQMITGIGDACVYYGGASLTFRALLEGYTFLDGSPCGKREV